jgi:gliding motility-associated-like protein
MYLYDYSWGDGTHTINNNPFAQHLYTNPGLVPFVLTLTDTLGCQDSVSKMVYVDGIAYGDFSASDSVVCVGEPIFIKDTLSPYTIHFEYDFGDGLILDDVASPLHVYDNENSYLVTLTTFNLLCPSYSTSHQMVVDGYPIINLGSDTSICPGITGTIVLNNLDNPSEVMTWSTGDVTNSISITNSGYYWASTVSANAQCKTVDSIHITRDCYLNIPNSFSPNDDGLNDYFIPRDLLSSGLLSFRMNIYNRWGENIFTSSSIDGRGWDGKYNQKPQNTGVYVYVMDVQFNNGIRKTFKGNVTLLR